MEVHHEKNGRRLARYSCQLNSLHRLECSQRVGQGMNGVDLIEVQSESSLGLNQVLD